MIAYNGKQYWQGLLNRSVRQMTEQESTTYMSCTMMEMGGMKLGDNPDMDARFQDSPQYKVIVSRLEPSGTEASLPVIMFISTLCDSPGRCVSWAYTLNLIRVLHNIEGPVKMDDLCREFPEGFPIESEYQVAWEEQKAIGHPLGNGVDKYENWPKAGASD